MRVLLARTTAAIGVFTHPMFPRLRPRGARADPDAAGQAGEEVAEAGRGGEDRSGRDLADRDGVEPSLLGDQAEPDDEVSVRNASST